MMQNIPEKWVNLEDTIIRRRRHYNVKPYVSTVCSLEHNYFFHE